MNLKGLHGYVRKIIERERALDDAKVIFLSPVELARSRGNLLGALAVVEIYLRGMIKKSEFKAKITTPVTVAHHA